MNYCMKWYADDSDIRTIKNSNVPNIVLMGGIVVSTENEVILRETIENAKIQFGDKRCPIKWNFKDLKKDYERRGKENDYRAMLGQMSHIRSAIFDEVSHIQFTIIASVVIGYSSDKDVLKKLKNNLSSYAFSNGLMRFSQHVKEHGPNSAEVVLDWPGKNFPEPYDIEYINAYSLGKSKDGIIYHSGDLESLKFNDSISYKRMLHCTLMQFSDMVLGATREFIHHTLDESSRSGYGIDLLKKLAPKFRGYPNDVIGRGIIINEKAGKDKIQSKFKQFYSN